MRVLCRHGHFAFFQKRPSEVARFTQYFDVELVRSGNFYTFPLLAEAPPVSLAGSPYLGVPAVTTYAGKPWEIMRENGFVYDIGLSKVVPKQTILAISEPELSGFCYLVGGALYQPGSRTTLGQQILSYDGEFDVESYNLKLSEFRYE